MISLCRKYRYPSTLNVNIWFNDNGIRLFVTWDSLTMIVSEAHVEAFHQNYKPTSATTGLELSFDIMITIVMIRTKSKQ
jgi:hypothetical protein